MRQSLEVAGKAFGVGGRPVGDEIDEDVALPSPGRRQQRGTLVGDRQLGAPGVGRRGRPGDVPAPDGGADEPAGAGSIDADLGGDVTDGDWAVPGGGVDRFEDEHVDGMVIDRLVDPASRPEADETEQRRPGVPDIACDTHVL